MRLEKKCGIITAVPYEILLPIIDICHKINWTNGTYQRPGKELHISMVNQQKFLRFPKFPISNPTKIYTDEQKQLLATTDKLLDWILSLPQFQGYQFIQGQISTLMPNEQTEWHIDHCWFHTHGNRLHIPIITNDGCEHLWENQTSYHLEVGYLYELNNRVIHTARNRGNTLRTHIILDVIPEIHWQSAVKDKVNPAALDPFINKEDLVSQPVDITAEQIVYSIVHDKWNEDNLRYFTEAVLYAKIKQGLDN